MSYIYTILMVDYIYGIRLENVRNAVNIVAKVSANNVDGER